MTLFIDCSYTRLQSGNVGITRVVRNLIEQFQRAPSRFGAVSLVCFGRPGFRVLEKIESTGNEVSESENRRLAGGRLLNAFRRVTSGKLRSIIVRSLPLFAQRILWRFFGSMTFAQIARNFEVAKIMPGDIVLLADAAWNYNVWECAIDARLRGAHVVTIIHDLIPLNHPEFVAPLFSEVFRAWFRQMLKCSTGVVCVSAATRDEVLAYCAANKIDHPQIGFFHLGSDFQSANTSHRPVIRAAINALINQPNCNKNLLFLAVGSVEKRKRHNFLLDAFERVWARHTEAKLIIAGRPGGESEKTISRLIKHPRLQKNLLWLSDATDEELDYLYRAAGALVFCSAAEGFGLPLVEARQLGCHVIASDIPVFRELADEAVHLFQTQDLGALVNAICNHIETDPQPARKRISLSWSDSAAQLLNEFNQILPQPMDRQ